MGTGTNLTWRHSRGTTYQYSDDAEDGVQKGHFRKQGVVATDSIATIPTREIFFAVDPMVLDVLNLADIQEMLPSGTHVELHLDQFMQYLPELEQEIFYLVFARQKGQKDIAKLLDLSQPTISYRYRRVLVKLSYLMILLMVDVKGLLDDLGFLKETERAILFDLLFYTNQELVGKKHSVRQSSVKWIFLKTKRRLRLMEMEAPERWSKHYGLMVLLERHLNSRIRY